MTDISIVIVNYNTRAALRRTLDSIARESGDLRIETIVVDNASKDDSAPMVRESFPQVIVIEPGHNTWFSGGNNLGFARASGETILILNPDTIVQPGLLDTMLTYLRAHPRVGAVTPQMRGLDRALQRTCSRAPRFVDLLLGYTFVGVLLSGWRERRRAVMWYGSWERDLTRPVEVAPGSCILARREVIAAVDGFDARLRLYFTEDDLCRRIVDAGYAIHFLADGMILHEEHASIRLVQRLASRIYFDDLIVYAHKWMGGAAALLLRALIVPTRVAMDMAQRARGERNAIR
ncbi:MAG: glycosyltransferase family 2 protein [Chloroflexota bacterium]|nr:glycosyltransferase family 2 protein [Chloroflexota bacterium]